MRTAIVWFRRDLRVADNPALSAALASAEAVVPLYVHSPGEEGAGAAGAASRVWLKHSLASLDTTLRGLGARLICLEGPVEAAVRSLLSPGDEVSVHWNRVYEPTAIARDSTLKARLREAGVEAVSHNGSVLIEPWELSTAGGAPYRVFSPLWRQYQSRLGALAPPLAAPGRVRLPPGAPSGVALDALGLLPTRPWGERLASQWSVGEGAARRALEVFCAAPIAAYATARELPAEAGTSRLSPHLHFGELSPRQALAAAQQSLARLRAPGAAAGVESFVRELVWREFAQHLLYHFPHSVEQPLDARFAALAWRSDPAALAAWQRGETGIPMVDAGMRELYATGWMHNRVRMIVASLLCKNLGLHWLDGARWFHDTLVDADLAANTLGWQWSAGCGADAAPYYRIFSPILQAERHDPSRAYLRRWLPELAALPDAWIHRPDAAPQAALAAAGIALGKHYPRPIVDLKASRARAMAGYATMRDAAVANPPAAPPRNINRRRGQPGPGEG